MWKLWQLGGGAVGGVRLWQGIIGVVQHLETWGRIATVAFEDRNFTQPLSNSVTAQHIL